MRRREIHLDQWDVVEMLGSSGRWTAKCIAAALFGSEDYVGRVTYMLRRLGVSLLSVRRDQRACRKAAGLGRRRHRSAA